MNERFARLPDGRSYLPKGTMIELAGSGGRYHITGEPVGYGGSGILYPAVVMGKKEGEWTDTSLQVALKECCPSCLAAVCTRTESGELKLSLEKRDQYEFFREMLHTESEISAKIFAKGFRLTPLQRTADEELMILPDGTEERVRNAMGVLERLDEKGAPLSELIREGLGGWQIFHLFNLVLRSLQEVHEAGFLHGDIQEHNIFVKGWDQDEASCELSLVDFGSARELLPDGASAPVTERILFTTKAYAAPECARVGEGTLRLTRAADLYSAGMLLLAMLNGRIPDQRSIALTVGGHYFLSRRAKKIGIPSGTVPKINEVLSWLLEQDPKKRCGSVSDALPECERIEQALAPKTSVLEAIDYDAFISYCHEEPAMTAALQIQKKLERFRPPRGLSRADGRPLAGRVFLDRAELNAGGDMEEHLKSALRHSAFLIVILSPGTASSPWVEREIAFFLESHSRDQVLTVLAEGDPKEVTPALLTAFEKSVDGVMKKTSAESLAADIRGKTGRERERKQKTEIYRLLAPMLGCGFDDLMQRRRAYRQQRLLLILSAAFVLSLAISLVIGQQALVIHRNYREALKREAVSLAEKSLSALESGDKKEAVRLALLALPDPEENPDMPETVQAQAALLRSLDCYRGSRHGLTAMTPETLFQMDYGSERLYSYNGVDTRMDLEQINEAGTVLACADESDCVYAWSLTEGVLLNRWDGESLYQETEMYFRDQVQEDGFLWASGEILGLAFEGEDTLLILTDLALIEADIQSGTLTVRGMLKEGERVSFCVCMSGLHAVLIGSLRETEGGDWYTALELLDAGDASLLASLDLALLGEETKGFGRVAGIEPAGGGTKAAVLLQNEDLDSEEIHRLLIWDPMKEQTVFPRLQSGEVRLIKALGEEDLAVFSAPENLEFSGLSDLTGHLSLYRVRDGAQIFEREISISTDLGQPGAALVENAKKERFILFWCGKQAFYFSETGEEIFHIQLPEDICGAALSDAPFRYMSSRVIHFCLEDGSIVPVNPFSGDAGEACPALSFHVDYFTCPGELALLSDRKSGKLLILKEAEDPRFGALDLSFTDHFSFYPDQSFLISFGPEEEEKQEVSVYRADPGEIAAAKMSSDPEKIASFEVCGYEDSVLCNKDTLFLYWEESKEENLSDRTLTLTARSVESWETVWKKEKLPNLIRTARFSYDHDRTRLLLFGNDEILLLDLADGKELLSFDEGELFGHFLPDEDFVFGRVEDAYLSSDGKTILAVLYNYRTEWLAAYDIEEKTWIDLPKELSEIKKVRSVQDRFLYGGGSGRYVLFIRDCDRTAEVIDTQDFCIRCRIPFVSDYDQELFLSEDDRFLLTFRSGEPLRVWDAATGELCSQSDRSYVYLDKEAVVPDEGIYSFRAGGDLTSYALDEKGQLVLLYGQAYSALYDLGDRYVSVYDDKERCLRIYPRRSAWEMIQEAKKEQGQG